MMGLAVQYILQDTGLMFNEQFYEAIVEINPIKVFGASSIINHSFNVHFTVQYIQWQVPKQEYFLLFKGAVLFQFRDSDH